MASEQVLRIFDELRDLHIAKDSDYAGQEPLSNFKKCEVLGIPAWRGAAIRMSDKWSRFLSLAAKDGGHAVKGETIIDTLNDLAVYAIITRALLEGPDERPKPEPCDCGVTTQAEVAKMRFEDDRLYAGCRDAVQEGMDEW